jgi:hypothetical protein
MLYCIIPHLLCHGESVTAKSPLNEWLFLIGEWKGSEKGQFGEKETIEGTAVFSLDPGDKFIMEKREAWSGKRLVNRSVGLLFYDDAEKKFKRKTFFSYGFVNNEVEYARTQNEIKFDITMEPLPQNFRGTQWRSFIRKISDKKVAVGLEVAKEGEDFQKYGETTMFKIK